MMQKRKAAKPPLGKDANIVAARSKQRFDAFKDLSFAQKLLLKHDVKNRKDTNVHRTRFCQVVRAYQADSIVVNISTKAGDGGASLSGVQTCGSVWTCPVCASRIAAQRGKEIGHAIDYMVEGGFIPLMLTNTAWHSKEMPLKWLKNKFKEAHRMFVQSRRWRELKALFGIKHSIKAVEVLYGFENGWHPHQHAIVFAHADAIKNASHEQLESWVSDVQDLWMHCLKSCSLTGIKEIALDVKMSGDVKKDYLAKLGLQPNDTANLEYEISGGLNKEGKGRTVWSMLYSARTGIERFEELYVEYAKAMSGDNWITWSHGLKDLCNIAEIADEEAANIFADIDAPTEPLMSISDEEFLPVRKLYAIGDLLDIAATSRDENTVREWLRVLGIQWNNSGSSAERDRMIAQLNAMEMKRDNWQKGMIKSQNFEAMPAYKELCDAIENLKKKLK